MNTWRNGGTGISYQFLQWELVDDYKGGLYGDMGGYLGLCAGMAPLTDMDNEEPCKSVL